MAKTETRVFIVHKPEKYDRFTQVGFKNLGKAMGKLDKIGAKNLYLYLVSNANNIDFELKVANYANWLGDPTYNADGTKNAKDSTYRNQINTGIKQLIEAGYLVQKYPGVYDFFEEGVETNNSNCNNLTDLEQSVIKETNSSKNNKVIHLEQSVTKETNDNKSDNLTDLEQYFRNLF